MGRAVRSLWCAHARPWWLNGVPWCCVSEWCAVLLCDEWCAMLLCEVDEMCIGNKFACRSVSSTGMVHWKGGSLRVRARPVGLG